MTSNTNLYRFPDGDPVAESAPLPAPQPPPEPMRRCAVVIDGRERVFVRPLRIRRVEVETAQERDARLAATSTLRRRLLAAHVQDTTERERR